jgi:hypothetical protein
MTSLAESQTPIPSSPGNAPIREALIRLAAARRERADLEALVDTRRRQWDTEHFAAIAAATDAMGREELAERDVRALALAHFVTTEDKAPAPGVSIILTTELEYSNDDAFAWAQEKGMALTLDKKAFAAIAKVQALGFVRRNEVAAVRIAQDLDKALGGAP